MCCKNVQAETLEIVNMQAETPEIMNGSTLAVFNSIAGLVGCMLGHADKQAWGKVCDVARRMSWEDAYALLQNLPKEKSEFDAMFRSVPAVGMASVQTEGASSSISSKAEGDAQAASGAEPAEQVHGDTTAPVQVHAEDAAKHTLGAAAAAQHTLEAGAKAGAGAEDGADAKAGAKAGAEDGAEDGAEAGAEDGVQHTLGGAAAVKDTVRAEAKAQPESKAQPKDEDAGNGSIACTRAGASAGAGAGAGAGASANTARVSTMAEAVSTETLLLFRATAGLKTSQKDPKCEAAALDACAGLLYFVGRDRPCPNASAHFVDVGGLHAATNLLEMYQDLQDVTVHEALSLFNCARAFASPELAIQKDIRALAASSPLQWMRAADAVLCVFKAYENYKPSPTTGVGTIERPALKALVGLADCSEHVARQTALAELACTKLLRCDAKHGWGAALVCRYLEASGDVSVLERFDAFERLTSVFYSPRFHRDVKHAVCAYSHALRLDGDALAARWIESGFADRLVAQLDEPYALPEAEVAQLRSQLQGHMAKVACNVARAIKDRAQAKVQAAEDKVLAAQAKVQAAENKAQAAQAKAQAAQDKAEAAEDEARAAVHWAEAAQDKSLAAQDKAQAAEDKARQVETLLTDQVVAAEVRALQVETLLTDQVVALKAECAAARARAVAAESRQAAQTAALEELVKW